MRIKNEYEHWALNNVIHDVYLLGHFSNEETIVVEWIAVAKFPFREPIIIGRDMHIPY